MASFNLIDRPWIPCIRPNGTRAELSLREVLVQAQAIREIQGDSPLETASILRVLLVMLRRIYSIEGRADWLALWRNERFDPVVVDEYLAKWKHRFDLFDAHYPFFQIADETQVGDPDPLNKIVHHLASEHAATLFDHTMAEKKAPVLLTPAQAARAVLATQYFGLGFQKFVLAPCARGVVCLVGGRDLFETLVLNFYPKDTIASAIPDSGADEPIWESENAYCDRTTPNGLCDFWTWPNRKIKLFLNASETVVEKVAWAPGLRLKGDITDPMQRWWVENDNWRVLRFDPDKALWRDSVTLLELPPDSQKSRPIGAVAWLSKLARFDRQFGAKSYRLVAFGMCRDREKAAEMLFLRAEATPLSAELLRSESLVGDLSRALEQAEKMEYRLSMSTFNLARLLLNPSTSDQETTDEKTIEKLAKAHDKSKDDEAKRVGKFARSWGVESDYWSRLGQHFHVLVNDLPHNPARALDTWGKAIRRSARIAFLRAQDAVSDDPRAARALAIVTSQFETALYRLLDTSQSAQPTDGGINQ